MIYQKSCNINKAFRRTKAMEMVLAQLSVDYTLMIILGKATTTYSVLIEVVF